MIKVTLSKSIEFGGIFWNISTFIRRFVIITDWKLYKSTRLVIIQSLSLIPPAIHYRYLWLGLAISVSTPHFSCHYPHCNRKSFAFSFFTTAGTYLERYGFEAVHATWRYLEAKHWTVIKFIAKPFLLALCPGLLLLLLLLIQRRRYPPTGRFDSPPEVMQSYPWQGGSRRSQFGRERGRIRRTITFTFLFLGNHASTRPDQHVYKLCKSCCCFTYSHSDFVVPAQWKGGRNWCGEQKECPWLYIVSRTITIVKYPELFLSALLFPGCFVYCV